MTEEFELIDNRIDIAHELDIKKLISSYEILDGYTIVPCSPATGILFISKDNPGFISGHVRMRGKNEGRYPFNYLQMIDNIFGYEANTIEVCSRSVPGGNKGGHCFTVDINPDCKPDLVTSAETLEGIADNQFDISSKLLKAGSRVCKDGALMFLLLGPTNYQACATGIIRIGSIVISVIPNNEWRTLNIFLKTGNVDPDQLLKSRAKPKPKQKNQSLRNFY